MGLPPVIIAWATKTNDVHLACTNEYHCCVWNRGRECENAPIHEIRDASSVNGAHVVQHVFLHVEFPYDAHVPARPLWWPGLILHRHKAHFPGDKPRSDRISEAAIITESKLSSQRAK